MKLQRANYRPNDLIPLAFAPPPPDSGARDRLISRCSQSAPASGTLGPGQFGPRRTFRTMADIPAAAEISPVGSLLMGGVAPCSFLCCVGAPFHG
jgi:hypothetical protein